MAPTLLLLAAATFAAPPAATAGRSVELAPFVGVRNGIDLEADAPAVPPNTASASATLGFAVIVPVRPDGWFEAFVDHQKLSFSGFDMAIDYLQFGGGYEPGEGRVRPFVAAGVGLTRYGSNPGQVDNAIGASGSLAGGFDAPAGNRMTFRFELRGYATITDAAISVGCGPGCFVQFGGNGWYQFGARAGLLIRL